MDPYSYDAAGCTVVRVCHSGKGIGMIQIIFHLAGDNLEA
jgi:hypothetical protein